MPNPKRKHSRARRDKRRANWKISPLDISVCPECNQPKLPHQVCHACGSYKGRIVVRIKEETTDNN